MQDIVGMNEKGTCLYTHTHTCIHFVLIYCPILLAQIPYSYPLYPYHIPITTINFKKGEKLIAFINAQKSPSTTVNLPPRASNSSFARSNPTRANSKKSPEPAATPPQPWTQPLRPRVNAKPQAPPPPPLPRSGARGRRRPRSKCSATMTTTRTLIMTS